MIESVSPLHLRKSEELHLPAVQTSDFSMQNLLEIRNERFVHVALPPTQFDGQIVSCANGENGDTYWLISAAFVVTFWSEMV